MRKTRKKGGEFVWIPKTHLLVIGSRVAIELESLVCCAHDLGVQQVGADHDACASLACLAMCHHNVLLILREPLIRILAELVKQLNGWRIVISKGNNGH